MPALNTTRSLGITRAVAWPIAPSAISTPDWMFSERTRVFGSEEVVACVDTTCLCFRAGDSPSLIRRVRAIVCPGQCAERRLEPGNAFFSYITIQISLDLPT